MRFPEFEGEWEATIIAKECIVNPKTEPLSSEFVYIDLESVVKGELLKETVINKLGAPSRAQRVLENYDILFQCVRPYQMNNYIYRKQDNRQWVASTGYAQIRTSNNPVFIYYLLNTPKFNKKVMLRCTGTSYPAIASNDLSKIDIVICSCKEQNKIASLLSLLDSRISTQSQIIENLQSLIKGLSRKLFSQQIRFKDSGGNDFLNWEIKNFDEVLMSVPTKKYQIKNSDYYTVGKYKVIDQGQELIAGYSDNEENVFYDFPVIVFGDHTTIIKYIDFPFVVGADGTKLLRNKKQENLKYLYYNLIHNNIKQDGYKRHFTILSEIDIHIPSVEEQNEIANFLSTIDEKLETEKQILQKYTEQKKYLLSNMFI